MYDVYKIRMEESKEKESCDDAVPESLYGKGCSCLNKDVGSVIQPDWLTVKTGQGRK